MKQCPDCYEELDYHDDGLFHCAICCPEDKQCYFEEAKKVEVGK